MMVRNAVLFLFLLSGTLAWQAQAAVDSFSVQFLFGEDTEAPTVPDPVTVTPVAPTQIDITWGAATDNVQVVGYQLFRDALQIATTSLLSFSDTGLTASTTYSYSVVAFDVFGNFSTSSTPVATTTLALPPPPVSPEGSSVSGTILLQERSFEIDVSTNGARFIWETNIPTTYVLRYSQDSNLDDGIVQGGVYARTHETVVSGLMPGTTYQYELVLTDIYGRTKVFRAGSFLTESMPDTTPPTNVGSFVATPLQSDVLLGWSLPLDDDFAYVRVVRNHRFFPQHESDGFVVYEGRATAVTDGGALSQYDTQYYTIFASDLAGNQSSGAVAIARRYEAGVVTSPQSSDVEGRPDGAAGVEVPDTDTDTGVGLELYPEQVFVEQSGIAISFADQTVEVMINEPYTIWVPASALPPHLKAIIVSVKNPTDQRQVAAYLLRLNEASERYEASIPGFVVVGESVFLLEVFDFNAAQVREITVPVRFVAPENPLAEPIRNWWTLVWNSARPLGLIVLLSVGVWWFFILLRRRNEEENEDNT